MEEATADWAPGQDTSIGASPPDSCHHQLLSCLQELLLGLGLASLDLGLVLVSLDLGLVLVSLDLELVPVFLGLGQE
jgi:hypothetical protein